MKSKMLVVGGYDRLLRCSNASECISILQEEGYFETAAETREAPDPSSWQNLFDTKIFTLVQKLARMSPPDCRELLAEFQNQYRLEFVKSGLRLMVAQDEGHTISAPIVHGLTTDLLRNVAESRNLELLVQVAGAPQLYGEISSALAENRPLPLIEAIVDRYGLTCLWTATDMLDAIDKQSARPLVGEHVDSTNLLLAVRSKTLGVASDEVQRVLVPVNYRLGDALAEAMSSGSATNALRALTKTAYSDSVNAFLETYKEGESLHQLETRLRRRHATSCLSAFSGFPFCAGFPLAFAYLMSYEVSDLRSIISGKHDSVAPEKIQEFITL